MLQEEYTRMFNRITATLMEDAATVDPPFTLDECALAAPDYVGMGMYDSEIETLFRALSHEEKIGVLHAWSPRVWA